jgi:hypothetical protein
MKVRYSFPVTGTLRHGCAGALKLHDWSFEFHVDPLSGFVDRLTVEIGKISKDNWPTLTDAKPDPNAKIPQFPFVINPTALRFSDIEPALVNLESILSVFGLEEVGFAERNEEWIPEDDSEMVSMHKGWSFSKRRPQILSEALSTEELARCIVAAGIESSETIALALFRVAQAELQADRFLETIRYSYFCIEHLFANGKSRQRATVEELSRSEELISTIRTLFFEEVHSSFEKIRSKYRDLQNATSPDGFIKFIVRQRGLVQHAGTYRAGRLWHPSRQRAYENEAICIFNVVEAICERIVREKLARVPIERNGQR